MVHGDDFFMVGPVDNLIKINFASEQHFQVKTEIIGPDAGQLWEARVLHGVIRWKGTSITWEPDPRHVEVMIEQMGLKGAKMLKIPGVNKEKKLHGVARGHRHDHRPE